MLQSVSAASYSLQTRLSRPELQAARGRRAPPSPYSNPTGGETNNNNHNENNTTSDSSSSSSNPANNPMADVDARNNEDLVGGGGLSDDEDGGGGGKSGKSKSRRELPAGAVQTLKAWLLSPEHFTHPYPTPQDQAMLMQKTGIDKKQLKNWFTNARRRIWKPMLKKQIEQGKLTTTAGGGVAVQPGAGLMVPVGAPVVTDSNNPHSVQAMRMHYQQAVQGQTPASTAMPQLDAYGNQVYGQQPHVQHAPAPDQSQSVQQYYLPPADSNPAPSPLAMQPSNSIGSLPPMSGGFTGGQLNKTDSHAVLMELFARDQDLVRQATESARMKAAAKKDAPGHMGSPLPPGQQQQGGGAVSSQHPMKSNVSQSRLSIVPSLNSWPHFSSVSSLNNLGNMPGVKSITSMSGVDLASQGNVNKMGNLAQVKSMESMGKNDSYAFLEVFFGDRSLGSSMNNLSARGGGASALAGAGGKGKRDREEDEDVGLSLDDEGPSSTTPSMKQEMGAPAPMSAAPQPAPLTTAGGAPVKDGNDTGTLKRAYDDALAARGLMSVSRSSEKLTDLALPAKMQRSLSQEYIRQSTNPNPQQFGQFSYTPAPAPAGGQASPNENDKESGRQYAGQHPGEPQQELDFRQSYNSADTETSSNNASVEVPAATKCAICHETNVDTQLRPCGHMFHERCLKPSLQSPAGAPKCPVDHIAMQSALLAVPTEDPQPSSSTPQPKWSVSNAGDIQEGGQSVPSN